MQMGCRPLLAISNRCKEVGKPKPNAAGTAQSSSEASGSLQQTSNQPSHPAQPAGPTSQAQPSPAKPAMPQRQ
ncbi:unnamed protein product [Symbiodinium sp. KB8]|nr:unnamed protein product [Symbiodinium sp. KB8]